MSNDLNLLYPVVLPYNYASNLFLYASQNVVHGSLMVYPFAHFDFFIILRSASDHSVSRTVHFSFVRSGDFEENIFTLSLMVDGVLSFSSLLLSFSEIGFFLDFLVRLSVCGCYMSLYDSSVFRRFPRVDFNFSAYDRVLSYRFSVRDYSARG